MEVQRRHVTHWEADDTCSYCGSLSPDRFMREVEAGTCRLGTTDKNYKVYVYLAEDQPDKLRCIGSSNAKEQPGPDWKRPRDLTSLELQAEYLSARDNDWVLIKPRGPVRHAKFYFQHLSLEQQKRFIELMNAKTLNFSGGYGFYRLPFFAARKSAAALPPNGETT